jgi:hypothetical protein
VGPYGVRYMRTRKTGKTVDTNYTTKDGGGCFNGVVGLGHGGKHKEGRKRTGRRERAGKKNYDKYWYSNHIHGVTYKSAGRGLTNSRDVTSELVNPLPAIIHVEVHTCIDT